MKESHRSMERLLSAMNYEKHKWLTCGGLKVVGLILGFQECYTMYPCFLCLWDSRADDQHYVKEWPPKQGLKPGSYNVVYHPLVEPSKILFPTLHIKLSLMKNCVKALDSECGGLAFLHQKFQRKSIVKIKAGIFDDPQIRKLIKNTSFDDALSPNELSAWCSLKSVFENFPGNHGSAQYQKVVDELMENFLQFGARMSVKMHFLQSHLDYFPENCGDFTEEQGHSDELLNSFERQRSQLMTSIKSVVYLTQRHIRYFLKKNLLKSSLLISHN
ncbi:hypothetical protein FHG87_025204 [Trinorchestia longiramus]|nr:hypothetical protein FHG87_025204 [Trinorchestia longiramus]